MKNWIVCFLLFSSFLVNKDRKGHQLALNAHHNKYHAKSDSIYVIKDLPILSADDCIGNLLTAVAKSNSKHYNPGKSFYGLILNNQKKYRYLEIFTDQWHDAKDTSYVAVIKLNNAVFLCSGDIQGNPLFHRISSGNTRIRLSIAKKSSNIPMPIEPSLQGTFSSCKGLPIYVEVYTINPISGYKMHVRH
jgi:hypothetical protein